MQSLYSFCEIFSGDLYFDAFKRCFLVYQGRGGELNRPGGQVISLTYKFAKGDWGRRKLCMVPLHNCHIYIFMGLGGGKR